MSNKKILLLSYIIAGLISIYLFDRLFLLLFDLFRISFFSLGVISLSTILAFFVTAIIFYFIWKNERANLFMSEVVIELKKVTWPSKKETSGSTIIVIVVVIIFSLVLGLYDFLWAKIITSLLKL